MGLVEDALIVGMNEADVTVANGRPQLKDLGDVPHLLPVSHIHLQDRGPHVGRHQIGPGQGGQGVTRGHLTQPPHYLIHVLLERVVLLEQVLMQVIMVAGPPLKEPDRVNQLHLVCSISHGVAELQEGDRDGVCIPDAGLGLVRYLPDTPGHTRVGQQAPQDTRRLRLKDVLRVPHHVSLFATLYKCSLTANVRYERTYMKQSEHLQRGAHSGPN